LLASRKRYFQISMHNAPLIPLRSWYCTQLRWQFRAGEDYFRWMISKMWIFHVNGFMRIQNEEKISWNDL
jgi:hypothetical protein